jgi:hypothetical protein
LASFTHGVLLYRRDGTPLPNPLPNLDQQVWSVSWSPRSHALAAGGFSGEIMWRTSPDAISPCKFSTGNWIYSTGWSPHGRHLAAGLGNGTTELFSGQDCKKELDLKGHTGPVSGHGWRWVACDGVPTDGSSLLLINTAWCGCGGRFWLGRVHHRRARPSDPDDPEQPLSIGPVYDLRDRYLSAACSWVPPGEPQPVHASQPGPAGYCPASNPSVSLLPETMSFRTLAGPICE